jgi:hypothetical protein
MQGNGISVYSLWKKYQQGEVKNPEERKRKRK